MNGKKTNQADLQCEEVVVDLDLLGDEFNADGGLVLVVELVVDITVRTKPRNRSSLNTETDYYVLLAKKNMQTINLIFWTEN